MRHPYLPLPARHGLSRGSSIAALSHHRTILLRLRDKSRARRRDKSSRSALTTHQVVTMPIPDSSAVTGVAGPSAPPAAAPAARGDTALSPELVSWLRCPRCRAAVERLGEAYQCTACPARYPIVLGIPDFRLYEDPLIPLADDYRKGEKLLRETEQRSFAEMVAYYWTLPTYPPTPAELSARFIEHVLGDAERIEGYAEHLGAGRTFLDVGCGAGMLVQWANRRFPIAVGADVGFRWLVIARHGLTERGFAPNVVCCCADALPFADGVFDTVTSVALLEHVPDAAAALAHFGRVTAPRGRVFTWTSNRFSLAPEPHVRVWGVGFLPRRLMPAYVRWRTGLAYDKKHLLSRGELRRAFRRAGLRRVRFVPPRVTGVDLAPMRGAERAGARLWETARRIPLVQRLGLRWFPVLQAVATRDANDAGR